jgi:hypothetical protein
MTRTLAILAALALAGCGGSDGAGVVAPTGPTGPTGPTQPIVFALTATQGAPLNWAGTSDFRGYCWDVTFSGPWAGWYYLSQPGALDITKGAGWTCYPGGALNPDGNGVPFNFAVSCPAGGCSRVIRCLYVCSCGSNGGLVLTHAEAPRDAAGYPTYQQTPQLETVCPK